jgi:hypothetical protein
MAKAQPRAPIPGDPASASLAEVAGRLVDVDEWSARVRIGPMPPDGQGLTALHDPFGAALQAHLAREIAECPGADGKVAAAYAMDGLAWVLGRVLSHFYLQGVLPVVAAPGLWLQARDVPWDHDGDSGIGRAWTLGILPDEAAPRVGKPFSPDFRAEFVAAFTDLVAPVLAALHSQSRLPRPALWRLAGDGLSGGLLSVADQAGLTPRLAAELDAIFRRKGHPLFARETAVVTLSHPPDAPPGAPRVTRTFRRRGGCCRAYTWGDGGYCSTCVLRKPEDQDRQFLAHLAEAFAEGERDPASA